MPLNLVLTTPGTYTLGDDNAPGNNTSVIRDGIGSIIYTFVHPADSLNFTATANVNITADFTDSLGAATFTLGSLTNPAASFNSIAMDNVRTTGAVTLASNGLIRESAADSGADIVAGTLLMSAVSGIGAAANRIETQASIIEAETGTGGINVSNFGSVQIGGGSSEIDGLDVETSGNINFSAFGTIWLAGEAGLETVHGGANSGNVALSAIGYNSDIIATTNLDAITAAGGNIVLNAGRDIGFGIAGQDFDNDVRAGGSITINAGRDVLVDGFADIVSDDFGASAGGNLLVNAGRNIHVRNLTGTDGGLSAAGSGGADVILTTGAGGALVLDAPTNTAVSSTSGNVIANADRILIAGTSGITANEGWVLLRPATAGAEIDLGSVSDSGFTLGISDAEIDRIFAPTLAIGSNTTGLITVSSGITPANAGNLVLRSGGDIAMSAGITTSGSLTLYAGDNIFISSTLSVGGALSIFVDTLGSDGGGGGFVYINGPVLGATSITINGAEENDTLNGFEGTDQTVLGYGGDDTITSSGEGHYFGNAGNDVMLAGLSSGLVPEVLDGGVGVDTVDTTLYAGSYTINLATGVTNYEYESFVNFENAITGAANDQIVGTAGDNVIDSGAGNDILNGGTGADTLLGRAGNDIYVIDNAGDVVDENAGGAGTDRVQSSVRSINLSDTIHFKGAIEAAVLTGSANLNLVGNGLVNALLGNEGNNVINGLGGADVMRGYAGNDIYVIDNAGDLVDESAGGAGTDRVQSSVRSINLSDTIHFKGAIEAAVLTGNSNLNLVGNGLVNTLLGNAGNNFINGLAGNDTLTGGAGSDIFVFTTAVGGGAPANIDKINDFTHGVDRIWLDDNIFGSLSTGMLSAANFRQFGTGPQDANDFILYNPANGALYYDADGAGGDAATLFALAPGANLTAADFSVF